MATIQRGVTGRRSIGEYLEPLAVSPRQACILLDVGNTHLYELISNGELETYLDGCSRKITMRSIRRRVARLLVSAGANRNAAQAAPQLRRRGRPRKNNQATQADPPCGRGRPGKQQRQRRRNECG